MSAPRAGDVVATGVSVGLLVGACDAAFTWRHTVVTDARGPLVALVVAAAVTGGVVLVGLVSLGAAGLDAMTPRVRRVALWALGACVGGVLGEALFSGTGVRRTGLRPWLLAASVGVGALAATWLARHWDLVARTGRGRAARVAAVTAALAVWCAHATVLVRQYALLHGLLAVAVALLTAVGVSRAHVTAWRARASTALAVCCAVVVAMLSGRQSLRARARQLAPVARYPVMAAGALRRGRGEAAADTMARVTGGAHLPLRGRDIVLVTVDALRADALRALGGRGRMPNLDALAAEGVTFRAAYCATPHTSYSLASLMMGTHARSILALPGPQRAHGTLAGALATAGYRTAGFYPPAVFAVDGDRFAWLRERHLDFASHAERYASAAERVREVSQWISTVRATDRVFVWVHLFEPHEPYEAHPEHPFGDDARSRYDAECAAADDAIGSLRAVMARARRDPAWIVTADHGEEFGEHGGMFHGTSVYDEQVRVPLVMRVPGLAPRVVDAPVSLVDLAPTITAGVGIARAPRVQGIDLGALAAGATQETRAFAATGSLRMVASGPWTLVVDEADDTTELYDRARDPHELRNLSDAEPERARRLRAMLAGWESGHARAESERDTAREPAPAVEAPLPDALLRAVQGDRSTATDVAALVATGPLPVRRQSAAVLGDLRVDAAPVRDALALATGDADEALARASSLSLARLGDARGVPGARAALHAAETAHDVAGARRAALALAHAGVADGIDALHAWLNDAHAPDTERDEVVTVLRALRDVRSLDAWVTLLRDLRLCPEAAYALGELGDARAVAPLRAALAAQGYPLSIRAIVDALVTLRAPDAAALVARSLAGRDALPDVFPLLARVHEPGGRVRGSLRTVTVRAGRPWRITPAPSRATTRVYLRVECDAPTTVHIDGVERSLPPGSHELALPWTPTSRPVLDASGPVRVRAVVTAPR